MTEGTYKTKSREPKIHPTAIIDECVEIGDWSIIGANVTINGDVKIGREAWIGQNTQIGGGRSELGSLEAGDFFHMGEYSFINIADEVVIGDEVGLGRFTSLYTHGGYLSAWNGFPHRVGRIIIGDNVWLPKATVLPDVHIGSRVVVAAESLVNKDLPPFCLAGGIPARVLKADLYRLGYTLAEEKKHGILGAIIMSAHRNYGITENMKVIDNGNAILVGEDLDAGTIFFPNTRSIYGKATEGSERVKELLRREGIRFKYFVDENGVYNEWKI